MDAFSKAERIDQFICGLTIPFGPRMLKNVKYLTFRQLRSTFVSNECVQNTLCSGPYEHRPVGVGRLSILFG